MSASSSSKSQGVASWYQQLPYWLRNRYVLSLLIFGVYISFFDHYSLLKQFELQQTLSDLEREKAQYIQTIEESADLKATIHADEERFARERYYMKRADEDVFIVE